MQHYDVVNVSCSQVCRTGVDVRAMDARASGGGMILRSGARGLGDRAHGFHDTI